MKLREKADNGNLFSLISSFREEWIETFISISNMLKFFV
ncbi:hypothetical protein LEP1GSC074_1313 [Leptospira noguchii str. Hook]|nr:hypothetical protein LEP1GSC074_1313 [Leptospira noguchii str. Hook]